MTTGVSPCCEPFEASDVSCTEMVGCDRKGVGRLSVLELREGELEVWVPFVVDDMAAPSSTTREFSMVVDFVNTKSLGLGVRAPDDNWRGSQSS